LKIIKEFKRKKATKTKAIAVKEEVESNLVVEEIRKERRKKIKTNH
jgi:hypothetical protein